MPGLLGMNIKDWKRFSSLHTDILLADNLIGYQER